jgi:XTP/dITP diphosphohydrolase
VGLVLVIASANPDKVAEIRAILGAALPDVELRPRPDSVGEVDETGDTLEDNARLKAVAISLATGLPAVADDTGLEVVALGGAPGVSTARFAGPGATYADNVAKLLETMTAVTDRRARFRTVALVRWPDGRELSAEGAVDGQITASARGDGGFGYDPVFAPAGGGGATFAELGEDGKHELSHRGRAFRALAARLESLPR